MKKISYLEFVYHIVGLSVFVGAISVDLGFPASFEMYGGRLKYYTIWNIWLAIFYYGLCVIVDFIHLFIDDQCHGIRKLRDYVYCSLVVPASFNVSLTFWGIFAVDPELILPKHIQIYIPTHSFYNHVAHTGPIVSTVLEAILVFHRPPSRFLIGCLGGLIYATVYVAWLYWIAFKAGFWVYPFLAAMSDGQRCFYISVSYLFGFASYYVITSIIQMVWRKDIENCSKMEKRKKKH